MIIRACALTRTRSLHLGFFATRTPTEDLSVRPIPMSTVCRTQMKVVELTTGPTRHLDKGPSARRRLVERSSLRQAYVPCKLPWSVGQDFVLAMLHTAIVIRTSRPSVVIHTSKLLPPPPDIHPRVPEVQSAMFPHSAPSSNKEHPKPPPKKTGKTPKK